MTAGLLNVTDNGEASKKHKVTVIGSGNWHVIHLPPEIPRSACNSNKTKETKNTN